MDSDFTTQSHLESLAQNDPSLREILNRYRSAPGNSNFSGLPVSSNLGGGSGNAVLLSNMLGQVQMGIQNLNSSNKNTNLDGFSLNVNADILRWIVLLLLVILLVWLFLKVNKKKKNPLSKKVERLEEEMGTLKKLRKEKTKDEDEDEDESFEDNLDDLD